MMDEEREDLGIDAQGFAELGELLFSFPPAKPPNLLNPLVLAYIGDGIYEVFVRQYVVSLPNHKPNHLHQQCTRYVSARAQSRALQMLMPLLTEEEQDIVRRGRNAKSGSTAKNADLMEYKHSTAFECLVGYLYYSRQWTRLRELLQRTLEQPQD